MMDYSEILDGLPADKLCRIVFSKLRERFTDENCEDLQGDVQEAFTTLLRRFAAGKFQVLSPGETVEYVTATAFFGVLDRRKKKARILLRDDKFLDREPSPPPSSDDAQNLLDSLQIPNKGWIALHLLSCNIAVEDTEKYVNALVGSTKYLNRVRAVGRKLSGKGRICLLSIARRRTGPPIIPAEIAARIQGEVQEMLLDVLSELERRRHPDDVVQASTEKPSRTREIPDAVLFEVVAALNELVDLANGHHWRTIREGGQCVHRLLE